MSVPASFPSPLRNRSAAGVRSLISSIVAADLRYAAGDYTGGASEQLWTLAAHGMNSGDIVHCVWQSAMGAVVGGEGSKWYVKSLSSSTFALYSDAALATISTNTADGNAAFIKGDVPDAIITQMVIPNIIHGAGDYTGGAAENIFTPAQGTKGLYEAAGLKLLYKSASGVCAGVTTDTTVYAKAPTVTYHQFALTAGGAAVTNTADGTAIFLRTS